MTEDTGIFFVSRWIRRNLTKVYIVSCIWWLQKHNTIFGIQFFFYGIQCFFSKTVFYADTCQYTEALRFNINLSLFTFFGTDFVAVCVVST